MFETEEDVEEQDFTEAQEQQTTIPDRATGVTQDRQSIRDSALEEAGTNAGRESAIADLAAKDGEITIDDLKKLPGSEGMTDEQLKAEWDKAVAAEASGTGEQEDEKAFKLPFPVYDKEGNKVDALEKISVRDLLEGNLQVSYQAMGKEQRKTLTEALRNASLGHWNEQKYNTTVEERNSVVKDLASANEKLDKHSSERKVWDSALTALAMGNIEPMRQLAQAYQNQLVAAPQGTPAGMVSVSSVEAERAEIAAGNQFIQETIIPAGVDIATRYGADPKEVLGAIEFFLKREPMQFLTREKIDSILKYDVPNLFEENGYRAGQGKVSSPNGQQSSNEIDELKKTVAALQSSIAVNKNKVVQNVRDKSKKIPPSGGGATPGAGDSMPTFKSRSQMKAWMQGDTEWAKA